MTEKILITQKEFDEFYAIDNDTLELTNKETGNKEMPVEPDKPEEEFLTAEEEEYDDKLFEDKNMEDTQP